MLIYLHLWRFKIGVCLFVFVFSISTFVRLKENSKVLNLLPSELLIKQIFPRQSSEINISMLNNILYHPYRCTLNMLKHHNHFSHSAAINKTKFVTEVSRVSILILLYPVIHKILPTDSWHISFIAYIDQGFFLITNHDTFWFTFRALNVYHFNII